MEISWLNIRDMIQNLELQKKHHHVTFSLRFCQLFIHQKKSPGCVQREDWADSQGRNSSAEGKDSIALRPEMVGLRAKGRIWSGTCLVITRGLGPSNDTLFEGLSTCCHCKTDRGIGARPFWGCYCAMSNILSLKCWKHPVEVNKLFETQCLKLCRGQRTHVVAFFSVMTHKKLKMISEGGFFSCKLSNMATSKLVFLILLGT